MSDEIKDGGPAFPTENEHQTGNHTMHFQGMSLRDYFAAKAMQAILTNQDLASAVVKDSIANKKVKPTDVLAFAAYEYADAMLAERTK